jgi:hypothetical protein
VFSSETEKEAKPAVISVALQIQLEAGMAQGYSAGLRAG